MITRPRWLAVASVLLLAAAGCTSGSSGGGAGASDIGVTATTITIGSHQPLSGPVANPYSEISAASRAYFDFVNDHGGVHGRKIVFDVLDDAYNPAQTVTVTHKLVEQNKVFAIFEGLGTPTHSKVVNYLNAEHVPDVFVASGCTCWNQPLRLPYTFGLQTDYVREGKILGTYIKDHFPGQKVAYFTQNNQFGQDGVKGLDTVLPASSVVARQTYEAGATDVTPQAVNINQSGADLIVTFANPPQVALLRLDQVKLNNHARLVVNGSGSEPNGLSGLLSAYQGSSRYTGNPLANPLLQGMISDGFLLLPSDPTSPASTWTKLFAGIQKKYLPGIPYDGYIEYGMTYAYTFIEALQRAGSNPTRQSLIAVINKGGFTGPYSVPLDYSPATHAGETGARVYTINAGTQHNQGPAYTTDDGDGPLVPYTTQPPTAPADGLPPS